MRICYTWRGRVGDIPDITIGETLHAIEGVRKRLATWLLTGRKHKPKCLDEDGRGAPAKRRDRGDRHSGIVFCQSALEVGDVRCPGYPCICYEIHMLCLRRGKLLQYLRSGMIAGRKPFRAEGQRFGSFDDRPEKSLIDKNNSLI